MDVEENLKFVVGKWWKKWVKTEVQANESGSDTENDGGFDEESGNEADDDGDSALHGINGRMDSGVGHRSQQRRATLDHGIMAKMSEL